MKKKILVGLLVLSVIAGAVMLGITWKLDGWIRSGVESAASDGLQTRATLGSAELSLLAGRLALGDFVMGNPEGFESPHAAQVGKIELQVEVSTLWNGPVVIDEIQITGAEMVLEARTSGTNLGRLIENLNPAGQPSPSDETPEPGSGPVLRVTVLRLIEPRVVLAPSDLVRKGRTMNLETIEVRDLGEETSTSELIERVLSQVLSEALAKGGLPPEVVALLEHDLHTPALPKIADEILDILPGRRRRD